MHVQIRILARGIEGQYGEAMQIEGARVLVTGAARGMGRLYVEKAVAGGAASVVCWDSDADALAALVREIEDSSRDIHIMSTPVDISDANAVADAAQGIIAEIGGIDVLINNAGIVTGALFADASAADIERTFAVNTTGPMHLTAAFLPGMIERRTPARIVAIASASVFTPVPRMAVYAASKAALAAWSSTLRVELERTGNRHIRVVTVYPSFVSTGMFAGARGPLLTPIIAPEKVVDQVWSGMLAGRPDVMMPRMVPVARALRGILPARAFDFVAGRLFGVYRAMDQFTGRR